MAVVANSLPSPRQAPSRWRLVISLGLLYGAIYFVEGIADPTDGLVTQPALALLKAAGHTTGQIAKFSALLTIPWILKPLYALASDFLPLAGLRRKSYLIVAGVIMVAGFAAFFLIPAHTVALYRPLLAGLFCASLGIALSDVVVDALMVEQGQPLGITGQLQALGWACSYGSGILPGLLGGFLVQRHHEWLAFAACTVMAAVTLGLSLLVKERRVARPGPLLADAPAHDAPVAADPPAAPARPPLEVLWQHARSPALLGVLAFLLLWNFNRFCSNGLLYPYMTQTLGMSESFYGLTSTLLSAAAVAACLPYGFLCRRFSMRFLVHMAIVMGILSVVPYWFLTADRTTAIIITWVAGLAYMLGTLVQVDLAARVCPIEIAGTGFAVFMSATDLSDMFSSWLGGHFFDHFSATLGPHAAFQRLVGLAALCSAACWLLWLVLPAAALAPLRAGRQQASDAGEPGAGC